MADPTQVDTEMADEPDVPDVAFGGAMMGGKITLPWVDEKTESSGRFFKMLRP